MTLAKFQDNQISGFEEEDFKMFFRYMDMPVLFHAKLLIRATTLILI